MAPSAGPAGSGRIRLLSCINGMHVGGTELNALRVAERLCRMEAFELRVACWRSDGPLLSRYAAAGIDVVALDRMAGPRVPARLRALMRVIGTYRPDIVHSHDHYDNVFATVAARLHGVPAVVASRRWWTELPKRSHLWANRIGYRLAHGVVANSEGVARLLTESDRVRPERVVVLPNFVEEGAFVPPGAEQERQWREALGIPSAVRLVGCVANLTEVKDHQTLLRAFSMLRHSHAGWHLVLVGDGPQRPALTAMAAALGMAEAVHFAGVQPNRPNPQAYCDIAALTSVSEGFPNAIVEAMAAARPVVATRVGGVPDAVADGETGFLVPPQAPEVTGRALQRLADEPLLRRRMGDTAQQAARARFHEDAVIPRIAAYYRALHARRPGAPVA